MKITPTQFIVLNSFRGTGEYVGKDAVIKCKGIRMHRLSTLLALRRKGLLEHFCAGQWYLTRDGQEALRKGNL